MKHIARVVLFILFAGSAVAQEATLTTPETVTATKVIVAEMHVSRTSAQVDIQFVTAGGVQKRSVTVVIPQADLASFVAAIDTAVDKAGTAQDETGGVLRRFQYRILTWIVDNSRLRDDDGQVISVTLVP